jgi:hypothetical protein
MRTNYIFKTNLLSALIVLLCTACLQAQTDQVGRYDRGYNKTTEAPTSRYRFVDSSQKTSAQSSQTQKAAVTEKLEFETASGAGQQHYAGPLDAKSAFPMPRSDFSTRPLQSGLRRSAVEYQSQMPANSVSFSENDPQSVQSDYDGNSRQTSAQEPLAPRVAEIIIVDSPPQVTDPAVAPQTTYLGSPRKAYYLPINEADVCDEWKGFVACGGLKAYPGHWGIRCLTGCDPCEKKPCDCHACRWKHGCKKCEHCDPCDPNADKCDRCRRRNDGTGYSQQVQSQQGGNDCGCAACAKAASARTGLFDFLK